MSVTFTVDTNDLRHILAQIRIAEEFSAPGNTRTLQEIIGPDAALLPYGLRAVDGSNNNLLPGQSLLGAADQPFPRLLSAQYTTGTGRFDVNGSAPGGVVTNNDYSTSGTVVDTSIRTASNLIADMSPHNPAAVAAWFSNPIAQAAYAAAHNGEAPPADYVPTATEIAFIPNQSPDIGLSPPFNGWMTLFGQFFDHGLDLVTKGGNGSVIVPLMPDDPLIAGGDGVLGTTDDLPEAQRFMVLTRATPVTGPGADGVLGTADDIRTAVNTTTPWIDQNQTYTSHPSHQVFLREYVRVDVTPGDGIANPVTLATGNLLNGGPDGKAIANWAEVKAQAKAMLGIELVDTDIHNVPVVMTDPYGRFIPGPNGYAQLLMQPDTEHATTWFKEGTAEGIRTVGAVKTGHAFLDDIAHTADPIVQGQAVAADADALIGNPIASNPQTGANLAYDNELLDRHFITGDGRGNENIGLTAVHTIFHSEHNRLVEANKQTILASGDLAFINEWLRVDLTTLPTTAAEVAALQWDGERLFQAAKFVTEMQYQHLVFEEFARTVQPNVDPFVFTNSADLNPAITAEFAHVVYRFGHSMLGDTVDRLGFDMQSVDADPSVAGTQELGLIEAFLNPLAFTASGVDTEAAAGAIIRGMTRQIGNEIDEFVVDALRNNLLGLPLDLATLNIARSREQGVPSLNEARAEFYAMTADAKLKPYESWADFAQNIKNPASVINFIAAYGDHEIIAQESTLAGKRAAATALVLGIPVDVPDDPSSLVPDAHTIVPPTDRLDFLTGRGDWNAATSGLNDVDFWIGGLAEEKMEFGGMLGNTFNFVFETQMENLQNGDRFYYLSRTQGMNLLNELEANTFSALVQRNTDLGDEGSSHLNGALFGRADHILELNQGKQLEDDPTQDDLLLQILDPKVVRAAPGADVDGDGRADGGMLKFSGGEHVVLGGTEGNDRLIGDKGIDTLWGDGGNDYLNGGMESDQIFGGDGDDVIEDPFGDEFIRGGEGNDAISGGPGLDILFGGGGKDFVTHSTDPVEVFAGRGDDFVLGGSAGDTLMGNEGNDWIEGGEGFDGLAGENSQLFFNSMIIGHDVLNGQGNDTDYDGESGDDIMVQGPGIQRNNGMLGFDWSIQKGDPNNGLIDLGISQFVTQQALILRDRNDSVEAASGWKHDDTLIGTERPTGANGPGLAGIVNGPATDSMLLSQNVALIDGFEALLKLTPGAVRGQTAGGDATPFASLAPDTTVFDPQNGGNILLGGAGSDTFDAKAGNDILDGDRWLNVRISIRDAAGTEVATADSLAGQMFTTPAGLASGTGPLYLGGMSLQTALMSRAVNPGQLNIVREIVDAGQGADVDTAIFSDVRANYTITNLGDDSFQVSHTGFVVTPTLKLSDGIDTLHNIERAQFADGAVFLTNVPATGAPTIDDTTPTELAAIRANVAGIADLNGLPTTFAFQWQSLPSTGTWTDITGATGQTFTPQQAQVGLQVRVAVSFTDQGGYAERVFSAPTEVVGDNIVDTGVGNTINGTAGADRILANGGNDTVNAGAGDDFVDGGAGADTINGAAGNDTIQGGTGNDTIDAGAGDDVVTWNGGAVLGPITLVGNDGRDVVRGGTEATVGDTLVVNGTLGLAETFRVYTVAAWGQVAGNNVATLSPGTEIVITRTTGAVTTVVAELQEIEEIRIGTAAVSVPNPPTNAGAGDSVFLIGNFATTSLNLNTVTIDGTEGNDTVDISGLTSAHRIVFRSSGGTDTIVGTLRPQDVIELAPGTTRADYAETQANGMTTLSHGSHSITFASSGTPTFGTGPGNGGNPPDAGTGNGGPGNGGGGAGGSFMLTDADLAGIKALVTGQPIAGGDDDAMGAAGVRHLSGAGNNLTHPEFGSADQPFIRLTDAHYGAFDPAIGNNALNPLFNGLDPRAISNTLGTQEADLPHQANGTNIAFMAFGQYFDHGLDFLPKTSANGTVEIGGPGSVRSPTSDNPVDLTRGAVASIDANGVPQHLNKTSPFVDQNQAYGSHELVGQFLRESDGHGGVGAHLLAGLPDPSNPAFNLLPTLRALIQHHWDANTVFHDPSLPGGSMSFREYYANFAVPDHAPGALIDPVTGAFDPGIVSAMAADFMGSGNALLLDTNPFVSLLDHFVAGDGRANENVSLTAMHTIWARNHNFHVDNLVASGFQGTPEEVFQAAKMLNEAEYQRVVFTEFADHLIGGIKGGGSHGFHGYDPSVDARISEEFASAVYRVGHSLISETLTVLGADGQPRQVQLVDAFLNPTNDAGAFTAPLPPGYVPQPGYAQLGANAILAGIATQAAEEVDFNIVDAVRNDLVRINADLFAFNVARGRDVGLGTLNQVRADLKASSDPYVHQAVGFAGDLSPYASWADFQARNGLSDTVIAQFKAAYPDLVLTTAEERAAFVAANPDIMLRDGADGTKIVSGIDRVDLWVGGLAEKHINNGVVGQTFWVVLHEQFDRLQEGDRFYYVDRFDNFDFYQNQVDGQTFADIVARNTGLTGLQEDIFAVSSEDGPSSGGTGTEGSSGGTTPPATGGTVPPATGGTTLPPTGETVPPATGGTVPPATGGTVPPATGGTTPPAPGETVPPATGGTTPPATGETVPPATGGTTPPATGETVPPATGGTVPPATGETVPPATGETVPPATGGTTPPATGSTVPPATGGTTGGETTGGTGDGDGTTPAGGSGLHIFTGTTHDDVLVGTEAADTLLGLSGDDNILAGDGADVVRGGEGNDFVDAGGGRDVVFGGAGNDDILAGGGDDMVYGDGGADRILAGAGNDLVTAGAGNDTVVGGDGNDLFVAEIGDASDSYWGDEVGGGTGIDTLDMSAITASITADLGTGLAGRGSVASGQSGADTLWGVENIVTGSGDDTITASDAVNVMDGGLGADVYRFLSAAAANGDTIASFQPGDKVDLSGIDANQGLAGDQAFTLASGAAFTGVGQLLVTQEHRADGDYTVVEGNTGGDAAPEFKLSIKGAPAATAADFAL